MRFDAYGRTTQVPERGASEHDINKMMEAGGMAGATIYKPRHSVDDSLLRRLNQAQQLTRDELRALREGVRKIPQEQVDFSQAQSIFSTEPYGGGNRLIIAQQAKVPGKEDPYHVAEWMYNPQTNYVDFMAGNPRVRPTLPEAKRLIQQALEWGGRQFGFKEAPSYFPISDSRGRLFESLSGKRGEEMKLRGRRAAASGENLWARGGNQ